MPWIVTPLLLLLSAPAASETADEAPPATATAGAPATRGAPRRPSPPHRLRPMSAPRLGPTPRRERPRPGPPGEQPRPRRDKQGRIVQVTAARKWPDHIGPFGLVSKEGRNSLFVGFAGQLMLTYENKEGAAGEPRVHRFKPLVRRVRVTLLGSVLSKSLRYYLQLSFAPGALELMDLWLQWRVTRYTLLRVGHQKVGFTRHRDGSFKNRTLVDWSILSPLFGDERQLGVALHGVDAVPEWLDWSIGVFTGINQRAAHALGVARTYGEPTPNPSDLADPGPVDSFHPELTGRVGYRMGEIELGSDTDFKGGPLRLFAGVGGTWDVDAEPTQDHAARFAAELLLKVHRVSVAASGYLSWARRLGGERLDLRWAMWGLEGRSSVLVRGWLEIALRYAMAQRSRGLLRDARDRADALVAAAPADEQDALRDQYALAGRVRRQHELSVGVNVYLIGTSLKWQTDASWLPSRIDGELRHDARIRSQVQLAF